MGEQFKHFTSLNYADQGKAFLNAYWSELKDEAENVWVWAHKFVELDLDKAEEGRDLDEFNAHRFLESLGETKTIKAMREEILDADIDFNKRLALIEYCLWRYKKNVKEFVNKPQGEGEAVKKAQKMLEEVLTLLEDVKAKAEVAKQAVAEAKKTEKAAREAAAEAKAKEDSAKQDAEAAKKAEEEEKRAVAELKAQEDAYNNKTEELKRKTEEGGVVSRNRAKNELAQHLEQDPLPLRTAKLTQEASARKAEKAREEAEASHKQAVAAREESDAAAEAAAAARKASEEASAAADAAVDAMNAKVKEAEAELEKAKLEPCGQGNVWWVERRLFEAKKYMPMSKGGIAKK